MSAPVLATRRLGKNYGSRIGVEGLDLSVDRGEIFGFLGPNGAGKTTTIRLLLGFLQPSAGDARIFDHDCWRRSHVIKRDVGYLPGDVRLYPWFTVRNAMSIAQAARKQDLAHSAMILAERFRLDPDLPVRKMSRGMRQKLGLIVALVHESKLLVLDEPTSGLDPLMQQSLAELLRERANRGCAVFFSSHTLNEVEQLCDRVGILHDGRIVADERLDDLRRRARRKVSVRFESEREAQRLDPPEFLKHVQRERDRWHAEIEGEASALSHWLGTQAVRDLSIGPPDLETIFYAYYRTED